MTSIVGLPKETKNPMRPTVHHHPANQRFAEEDIKLRPTYRLLYTITWGVSAPRETQNSRPINQTNVTGHRKIAYKYLPLQTLNSRVLTHGFQYGGYATLGNDLSPVGRRSESHGRHRRTPVLLPKTGGESGKNRANTKHLSQKTKYEGQVTKYER